MPKLAIIASSVKVGLYLWKPGTKEERLKNDVRKLYLQNHEKTRTSWLNFGEDMKKEARRKSWTLGRFLGDWQPDLLEKVSPEPKVRRVFWESFLLQS